MNFSARSIASALVHTAKTLPAKELPEAVDAALILAKRAGVSRHTFFLAVKRELQVFENLTSALLETVSGDAGPAAKSIATHLETTLKKNVQLREKASPVLGGAILTVGDDRLDLSITSSLTRALEYLRAPTLVSSTSV
jgi:hypothetical protein